ncbi:unnamed protein product, partial [Polarella glacialis]
ASAAEEAVKAAQELAEAAGATAASLDQELAAVKLQAALAEEALKVAQESAVKSVSKLSSDLAASQEELQKQLTAASARAEQEAEAAAETKLNAAAASGGQQASAAEEAFKAAQELAEAAGATAASLDQELAAVKLQAALAEEALKVAQESAVESVSKLSSDLAASQEELQKQLTAASARAEQEAEARSNAELKLVAALKAAAAAGAQAKVANIAKVQAGESSTEKLDRTQRKLDEEQLRRRASDVRLSEAEDQLHQVTSQLRLHKDRLRQLQDDSLSGDEHILKAEDSGSICGQQSAGSVSSYSEDLQHQHSVAGKILASRKNMSASAPKVRAASVTSSGSSPLTVSSPRGARHTSSGPSLLSPEGPDAKARVATGLPLTSYAAILPFLFTKLMLRPKHLAGKPRCKGPTVALTAATPAMPSANEEILADFDGTYEVPEEVLEALRKVSERRQAYEVGQFEDGQCLADFAGPNVAVSGDEALPRAKGPASSRACKLEYTDHTCHTFLMEGPHGYALGPRARGGAREEQVEITNTSEEPLVIGDHNLFEVGARILGGGGRRIGDANVFECRATLDPGCSVGSGCTLGVGASLTEGESLPDETVVVGPPGMRHTERGAKEANTQAHTQAVLNYIEVLKETLPRCHHLRKSQPKTEC